MDQAQIDIENNEGQAEPLATFHNSSGREEVSNHAAKIATNEDIHSNPGGRWLSDNAVLKN